MKKRQFPPEATIPATRLDHNFLQKPEVPDVSIFKVPDTRIAEEKSKNKYFIFYYNN